MPTVRWSLSYAFKGKVHNTPAHTTSFESARNVLLARLTEIESCQVSELDPVDTATVLERPNGSLKIADLSCRNQWAYQRTRVASDGRPQEREEFLLSGGRGGELGIHVMRYRALADQERLPEVEEAPKMLTASAQMLDIGDGMRLVPRPWRVATPDDAVYFWNFVRSSERFLTMCVYMESPAGHTFQASQAAQLGFGLCHVFVVSHAMLDEVRMRKPIKCDCRFDPGSVAFVQPAWCLKKRETHLHVPFASVRNEYLETFQQEHGIDISPAMASNDQVFERTHVLVSSTRATPAGLLGITHVERGIEKVLRDNGPDPKQLIATLESALEAEQAAKDKALADIQTWQALCADMEKENVRIDGELRGMDAKLTEAKTEVARLRTLLWEQKPEVALVHIPIPDRYEYMDKWCQHHLKGKLVLHSRAIRELKDAQYRDVELVYKSLLLLGNQYRDMRLATGDASKNKRRAFTEALAELHLGFVSTDSACREYDGYDIEWPLGSGRTRTMESHLKRGKTFDPCTHLRVYFIWDEEDKVVVVGSLPKHLQNHLT